MLRTFGMVITGFYVKDKPGRAKFFQKSFLLAETSIEVVLEMPIFTFYNANIQFTEK